MSPSPSDLFLSQDLTVQEARRYLQTLGFRDPAGAEANLRLMADDLAVRQTLGSLAEPLIAAILRSPDPDAALVGFSRYLAARSGRVMFLEYLRDDPSACHALTEILGASPLLSETLIRNPEYLHWLIARLDRQPSSVIEDEERDTVSDAPGSVVSALDGLKRFKRRQILRIATRDILGREPLQAVTAQLSNLAGLLVGRALDAVTRQLVADEERAEAPGAFAVLGMGKLGGSELNYSSDIDLIYVYDPKDEDDPRAHAFHHRLARKLTAALGEHTNESYLYRVDLRLRPMGSRGNVAYSLRQSQQYYQTWGETFERFALIKCRPIAGDERLGQRFVDMVQPFVYRRYLDYAAIEEMDRHKQRVDRRNQDRDADRNVKTGRGGIREIELFTQVLQVMYGAQQPHLRTPHTLTALAALREAGAIPADVADELTSAYTFLRTVEHRLQIVHGSQTHSVSPEPVELEITARRLGFETAEKLEAALTAHRDRVHAVYNGLFQHRPGTSDFQSRQFFRILTDDLPRDEALVHLEEQGLRAPETLLPAIDALSQAASLTHAPSVARNVLANLLALWTPSLARCARPGEVLNRFEQLARRVGALTLLCQSLLEDERLRDILADVLDSGDLLAQRLVRYPELLDSLLLTRADGSATAFEPGLSRIDQLDASERADQLRRFKSIEEFKILVGWLAGWTLEELQEQLSRLADHCVERAARWHPPARAAGRRPPRPAWAIVALGKLGGRELAVHSDLDLVFLYEGNPTDSSTFVRYQAFVEAIQAFLQEPTNEGVAYRIDTRLRPEGTKGALATPMASFRTYLETRAEAWERMAWTRWRILAGSGPIVEHVGEAVTRFVYGPWDARIPRRMHNIRMRMERELAHETADRLDFKVGRGGLADIDFVLQLIQIREGGSRPEFRVAGSRRLLAELPPNPYLRTDELSALRDAHQVLRRLETFARMESDASISSIPTDAALLEPLGRRLGVGEPAGERLLRSYRDITGRVRSIYEAALARLEDRSR